MSLLGNLLFQYISPSIADTVAKGMLSKGLSNSYSNNFNNMSDKQDYTTSGYNRGGMSSSSSGFGSLFTGLAVSLGLGVISQLCSGIYNNIVSNKVAQGSGMPDANALEGQLKNTFNQLNTSINNNKGLVQAGADPAELIKTAKGKNLTKDFAKYTVSGTLTPEILKSATQDYTFGDTTNKISAFTPADKIKNAEELNNEITLVDNKIAEYNKAVDNLGTQIAAVDKSIKDCTLESFYNQECTDEALQAAEEAAANGEFSELSVTDIKNKRAEAARKYETKMKELKEQKAELETQKDEIRNTKLEALTVYQGQLSEMQVIVTSQDANGITQNEQMTMAELSDARTEEKEQAMEDLKVLVEKGGGSSDSVDNLLEAIPEGELNNDNINFKTLTGNITQGVNAANAEIETDNSKLNVVQLALGDSDIEMGEGAEKKRKTRKIVEAEATNVALNGGTMEDLNASLKSKGINLDLTKINADDGSLPDKDKDGNVDVEADGVDVATFKSTIEAKPHFGIGDTNSIISKYNESDGEAGAEQISAKEAEQINKEIEKQEAKNQKEFERTVNDAVPKGETVSITYNGTTATVTHAGSGFSGNYSANNASVAGNDLKKHIEQFKKKQANELGTALNELESKYNGFSVTYNSQNNKFEVTNNTLGINGKGFETTQEAIDFAQKKINKQNDD